MHILAGDSIASRFPVHLLPESPAGWLLRGWPGETVDELTMRIGEQLDRRPGLLVLQTGTNDVLRGRAVDAIESSYRLLVEACLATMPPAALVICTMPPAAAWRADPEVVGFVNVRLRAIADDASTGFVDLYAGLSDSRGVPRVGMTKRDGVHLLSNGYILAAQALSRELRGL